MATARRTARPKSAPEAEAPEAAPTGQPVETTQPLYALVLSELNARQTERDADTEGLAEDIAEIGLLNPLLVVPAHFSTAEPTTIPREAGILARDQYEVIGGGRRLQAMQMLQRAGRLPFDHPVSVKIYPRTDARAISLSENLHRVAMNPADEFEAFARIAGESDVATCAKRFGKTARYVEERLRLAALAPELLEALRSGEIGVDSAKAYAITGDHDAQVKVFKAQQKANWNPHQPRTVRDALRGITVPLDDIRAAFVTLDAYRAAGGRTETEMFMGEEGQERLIDAALLDQLTRDKAREILEGRAASEGYAECLYLPGTSYYMLKLPKVPDGFSQRASWQYELPEGERTGAVAFYWLTWSSPPDDASDEEIEAFQRQPVLEYHAAFVPDRASKADDVAAAQREAIDWEARRIESERIRRLNLWSARLGVKSWGDSLIMERGYWPDYGHAKPLYGDDDQDENAEPVAYEITVTLRVMPEEMAAQREAAEAKIAEEDAAIAEAKAAQDAELAAREAEGIGDDDEYEPGDGDDD